MAPKKKEKESETAKTRPPEQYQADHELFLNAFEKPTQIYRFLRTRNMISPIFLNRTLTYMRERMSRNNSARKNFKVNSLLGRIREKCQGSEVDGERRYLNITFLGFYDKACLRCDEFVKVETSVTKMSHKKRKDSATPLVKLFVGTSEVPVNPSEDHPPSKAPVVSIPSDSFSSTNGNVIKTYILYLKVIQYEPNHYITVNDELDSLEPSAKRLRREETKYYASELTVYDKHNRCLLMTGDYELGVQEIQPASKMSPKKTSQWITMESTHDEAFEIFSKGPMIKFRLEWSSEQTNGFVDRPKPFRTNGPSLDVSGNKENRPDTKCVPTTATAPPTTTPIPTPTPPPPAPTTTSHSGRGKKDKTEARPQIVYQFLYNNNSRQQTEACDDLMCPWCSLNCLSLYSLLKHLKLCHSRFTFTYNQIPQGARIDVAINECYDGSYTGSPHDLVSQPPGFAFSRNGPVRRTSITNILVCHPKRPRPSLSEFVEQEDNDFDGQQRPYITGHNRLYHHTTTCLPVYPKEMDIDSEGENDPKWLQQKTIMMIDDFTDVNEGEKELMKLWNLHVMKHGYVGDCQIPLACIMFLQAKGDELLKKNLYRNFVLHVCNLFDFGLISSQTVYSIIGKAQDLFRRHPAALVAMRNTWMRQREIAIQRKANNAAEGQQQNQEEPQPSSSKEPDSSNEPSTSQVTSQVEEQAPITSTAVELGAEYS